jgi:hypothetical protein
LSPVVFPFSSTETGGAARSEVCWWAPPFAPELSGISYKVSRQARKRITDSGASKKIAVFRNLAKLVNLAPESPAAALSKFFLRRADVAGDVVTLVVLARVGDGGDIEAAKELSVAAEALEVDGSVNDMLHYTRGC